MFAECMSNYGIAIIGAIATAVFAYLGTVAKRIAEKYINTAEKKRIAHDVVRFAEQVYHDCDGEEKLDRAMTAAQEMLAEAGITFNELEMRVLIEAALKEFKENFWAWEADKPAEKEEVQE